MGLTCDAGWTRRYTVVDLWSKLIKTQFKLFEKVKIWILNNKKKWKQKLRRLGDAQNSKIDQNMAKSLSSPRVGHEEVRYLVTKFTIFEYFS